MVASADRVPYCRAAQVSTGWTCTAGWQEPEGAPLSAAFCLCGGVLWCSGLPGSAQAGFAQPAAWTVGFWSAWMALERLWDSGPACCAACAGLRKHECEASCGSEIQGTAVRTGGSSRGHWQPSAVDCRSMQHIWNACWSACLAWPVLLCGKAPMQHRSGSTGLSCDCRRSQLGLHRPAGPHDHCGTS